MRRILFIIKGTSKNSNECHSEQSEESLHLKKSTNSKVRRFFTPLRSVQNDKSLVFRTILNFILFALPLSAQEFVPSLKWSGEVRVRSEVDMRDFNNLTPANTYTLLRSRLALEAKPLENVRVFMQAQDSRVFGEEASTQTNLSNLDLHQGYIELSKLFIDELSLRLGRQELSFGSERFIGAGNFGNVGRAFDGGLLRFTLPSAQVDLLAMNLDEVQYYQGYAVPTPYRKDTGYDLYGMYSTVSVNEAHQVDGYLLYQWDRGMWQNYLDRYTIGAYGKGKFEQIDYQAEFAWQGGKRYGETVQAYMATGMTGYDFEEGTIRNVAIGYDRLSGTPFPYTTYSTFDPAFHSGHKYYGLMDYFTDIPGHTDDAGLQDMFVRATVLFSEKVLTRVWLHYFKYAEEDLVFPVYGSDLYILSHGIFSSDVGQEIDIVTTYNYNPNVLFEIGTCAFLPGEVMRHQFGSADVAWWGYLSTAVKF